MENHRKDVHARVEAGRAEALRGIRSRAVAHKMKSRSKSWWTEAERDRADLLMLHDLLIDDLEDARAELKRIIGPDTPAEIRRHGFVLTDPLPFPEDH